MSVSTVVADEVYSTPLDEIDVSHPKLFQRDTIGEYFKRLREEDPVHYCANGHSGAYWSVTKFNDIVRVDTDHKTFSSDTSQGGIFLDGPGQQSDATGTREGAPDMGLTTFIAMDPPKHDEQRKVVSP
ncbi:MAG TPA: cytochrome P450, partial [Alphaproteobacteria bacterium]|nr:cytochrome P450 [Alphaproteobacteria bacterium]